MECGTRIRARANKCKGVSILFNNNFEYTILDTRKYVYGNFLALKILIENQFTICLIAIYGPNNDSPEFFGEIRDIVDSLSAHSLTKNYYSIL